MASTSEHDKRTKRTKRTRTEYDNKFNLNTSVKKIDPIDQINESFIILEDGLYLSTIFIIVEAIIDGIINVNYPSPYNGNTLLMLVAKYCDNQSFWNYTNYELIKKLIKIGADVNSSNNEGITALMFASRVDNSGKCLQLLLDSGARIDVCDDCRWSSLMWASWGLPKINPKTVKILIDNGANTEIRESNPRDNGYHKHMMFYSNFRNALQIAEWHNLSFCTDEEKSAIDMIRAVTIKQQ